jgi:hypothetical protein
MPVPPDFLYAALDTAVCASFIKESRMNLGNANKLYRRSGARQPLAYVG